MVDILYDPRWPIILENEFFVEDLDQENNGQISNFEAVRWCTLTRSACATNHSPQKHYQAAKLSSKAQMLYTDVITIRTL